MTHAFRADDLTVQQLRSFCVVYERESYAEAAAHLDLAVPTIWEQVQALQGRYRTTLFARRGRRIERTPAATALYHALRPVLAGVDSSYQVVHESAAEESTLTIVAGVRMLLEDLGEPLARFQQAHPRVRLRLVHGDNRAAEARLAAGEADLGLTLEPDPGQADRAVTYERAYPIEGLAVLPTGHPLGKTSRLRLADLVAHPLIVGHRETYGRHLLEQALHRDGLLDRLVVAAETDNSAFTCALVRAGAGVGVIAGRADGMLSRGLAVRSLRRSLGQIWIAFARQAGRQPTVAVDTLMRLIMASADEKKRP